MTAVARPDSPIDTPGAWSEVAAGTQTISVMDSVDMKENLGWLPCLVASLPPCFFVLR